MLLFREDLNRYPDYIIETHCRNQSFVRYSQLLKKMGVKNHLFPLVTLHPHLANVNPFDPGLPMEYQALVVAECKLNPWYYLRNCVMAPGSTETYPIYYEANRANIALFWLYFNHVDICLVQPRQTGKTFGAVNLIDFLLNIGSLGARILLVTKDEGLRDKTLSDMKQVEDMMPPYLKQHTKHDVGNREEIKVSSMNNEFKAAIARNDVVAANKTGRGQTAESTWTDEFAYLPFIEVLLQSLLPSTTAARARAEYRNIPYGNIYTTTAGKKDDRDGKYAYDFFNAGAPFSEFFFDADNNQALIQMVKTASKTGQDVRVHAVFSHRQLGYTDQWLQETARKVSSYGDAFDRDFRNIWTSGGQGSPFSVEDSERMRKSEMEVQYGEISRYGQIMTRWYLKEDQIQQTMASTHTVCSVDTSTAVGRDEFAVTIRSLKTGEVLGCCGINEINLITISNFLVELLVRFSKMTMIIERRDQAATIIDSMHQQLIAKGVDPFKRMYNLAVQDYMEKKDRFLEIQNPKVYTNEYELARYRPLFGFATSGGGVTARSELYSTTLRHMVKYCGDGIKDKTTIDQILSLMTIKGRIDHPPGGHDDMVMSLLLGQFFMTYGKNLQYYGIPVNYVLAQNQVLQSASSREEQYRHYQTKVAKARIDTIMESIRQEKDPFIIDRYIFDIENIKRELGDQNDFAITIDGMINQIRQDKTIQFQTKRSMFGGYGGYR